MKFEQFEELLAKMLKEEQEMAQTKGRDYTVGNDRLDNFRRIANEMTEAGCPMTMAQVWFIYFKKHLDAIRRYCCVGKSVSEPIESRILDARVYLSLLRAIVEEEGECKVKE